MTAPDDNGHEFPHLRSLEAFPVMVQGQQALCLRDPVHYSDAVVSVSPQIAAILPLFDGAHSLLDIQEAFARRFGTLIFREQLLDVIRSLDEHLLLDSPRFADHRSRLVEEFRRAPDRTARLAGMSYPAEPETLRAQLSSYFTADGGPGDSSPKSPTRCLTGLLVPHIDFTRGGPCYAWGYQELKGVLPVDRWVILGTVHAPIKRPFALTRKDFGTPLGPAAVDRECMEALIAQVGEQYLEDEFAHRGEHSIEFQCVFLRHLVPAGHTVRIVPILCGSFHQFVEARRAPGPEDAAEEFLRELRNVLAGQDGRTVILASADLAHVGPQFGDQRPMTPGQLREVEAADREMLRYVEAGAADAFFHSVARDGDRRRICGLPPMYAMLRVLDGCQGRLLRYAQWPDPNGTVTFAALALYAGDGGDHRAMQGCLSHPRSD